MPRQLLLLGILGCVASEACSSSSCPSGLTPMANFTYSHQALPSGSLRVTACEDLRSSNGTIVIIPAASGAQAFPFPITLQKRVYSNQPIAPQSDDQYLNYTKAQVLAASSDLLGNQLLGIHGFQRRDEPSWDQVANAIPPIRNIGAYANGAGKPRVWTANRESGRDIVLDGQGNNHLNGAPNAQIAQRFLTGSNSTSFNAEGTVVGIPAIVLNFEPIGGAHQFTALYWKSNRLM